jgi:predicted metal-dependent hydrolase
MPTASSVILSNGQPIDFVVRRSKQSKRVTLRLYADGILRVAAPRRISDKAIVAEIQRCSEWILAASGRLPERKEGVAVSYANGSQHLFLGELFVLKWAGRPLASELVNAELCVHAASETEAAAAVQVWYRAQALAVFTQRLEHWSAEATWVGIAPPLAIKRMKSRWGSCSAKGRVNLNLHLIKAPLMVIDEVVVHELCHLKEMNHGPRFYHLLDELLPEWRESRLWLKANSDKLIADHGLWK